MACCYFVAKHIATNTIKILWSNEPQKHELPTIKRELEGNTIPVDHQDLD